jgi:mannosylglycerate hydrolase
MDAGLSAHAQDDGRLSSIDLLEIMDRVPEYCFLLDAQAVPLEDYLEVMPEERERLRQYVSAGRINAGPWYTALDMNCLAGESIVRNLLWGHVTVEPFGPVMKVGYTPFGWGQVSQLPQIYRGFGIDVGFFYRGITPEQTPQAEFVWQGADGSELLTSRFGTGARYNFYFDVWRKALYDGMTHKLNRRLNWFEDATPFKLCDADSRYEHGYVMRQDRPIVTELAQRSFRDLLARERQHFGTSEIAFMHGMDTSTPDLREGDVLIACQQALCEGEDLFYSSLPRYAGALRERLAGRELPRVVGEVRHTKLNEFGFSYIGNDIISARTRQKVLTTKAEDALIRRAEPFAAMAHLLGAEWPRRYFGLAWRQFMKCHPHDTIGGCGGDRLEQDATYRLRDCLSLTSMITSEALLHIQQRIDTSTFDERGIVLTVFNPSMYSRTAVVSGYVDVPREFAATAFEVLDHVGQGVPVDAEPTGHVDKVFRDHADLALMSDSEEYLVQLLAEDVPALGYATYLLRPVGAAEPRVERPEPKEFVLENDQLRVTVNANGTVDLLNKATRQTYCGLNYFEDGGDVGHAWSFVRPMIDLKLSTLGLAADLERIATGAISQTIRATLRLPIPATTPLASDRFDWRKTTRLNDDLRPLEIVVEYTLARGADCLDVVVRFDNQCENHRLRAMFPTGVHAAHSFAESAFDVVHRQVHRDAANPYADEAELTYPMTRFAGVSAAGRSFAVIGGGLHEYEALDDEHGTFALTLMRAYANRFCTSGDYDLERRPADELAQSRGQHVYRYQLFTAAPGPGYAAVSRAADALHAPLLMTESKARQGDLPLRHGLIQLDNPSLVVTGITQAARDERLIIRFFNPTDQPQAGRLMFAAELVSAQYTDLNEAPLDEPRLRGEDAVSVTAAPRQIRTIAVTLA